jgi:hypothetical protein
MTTHKSQDLYHDFKAKVYSAGKSWRQGNGELKKRRGCEKEKAKFDKKPEKTSLSTT